MPKDSNADIVQQFRRAMSLTDTDTDAEALVERNLTQNITCDGIIIPLEKIADAISKNATDDRYLLVDLLILRGRLDRIISRRTKELSAPCATALTSVFAGEPSGSTA